MLLKKTRERIRDRFNIRLKQWLTVHCQLVTGKEILMGIAPINYKCYYNTVQKVKEGADLEVWACIYWDNDTNNAYVLHFLNRDKDGNFIENTLGYLKDENSYYILRQFREPEFDHVAGYFSNMLDYFNSTFLTPLERWLLGECRVI